MTVAVMFSGITATGFIVSSEPDPSPTVPKIWSFLADSTRAADDAPDAVQEPSAALDPLIVPVEIAFRWRGEENE